METLRRAGIAPAFSDGHGDSGGGPSTIERKRADFCQLHAAHTDATCRRMVKRLKSGATGDCGEIQLHGWRALRSLPLTDRFAARPEVIPGEYLPLSPRKNSAPAPHPSPTRL